MSFPTPPHLERLNKRQKPNIILMNKLILKYIGPILRSWKTTLAGVATIASGVAILAGVGVSAADGELSTEQALTGWGLITAGIAQIVAKDATVTGK